MKGYSPWLIALVRALAGLIALLAVAVLEPATVRGLCHVADQLPPAGHLLGRL